MALDFTRLSSEGYNGWHPSRIPYMTYAALSIDRWPTAQGAFFALDLPHDISHNSDASLALETADRIEISGLHHR